MDLLRKILLGVCCLLLVVSLTGCVYYRLAKVKKQLRNFDENVEIIEDEYFSIVFKREYLLPKDIVWLMKQEPENTEGEGDGLIYNYILAKQYEGEKNEDGNYDLPMRYVFREGRMWRLDLDKRYLAIFPKRLIIASLKAIGGAEIDLVNKSMKSGSSEKNDKKKVDWEKIDLPDVNDVVASLGRPYDVNDNVYTWKYLHKKSAGDDGKDKYSKGEITFDKKSGKIMKASSKLYGMGIIMDFSDLYKEAKAEAVE